MFSPKTVEAYDRVFTQLKAALGPQIDALRIGSPYDYGETHYPAGDSNRAFPDAHMHQGWWAGEPEAKEHFRRWVEKKYGGIDRLNAAWGTQFTDFAFDYPRDPTSARRWLDFVEWYHEAFIERLGVLFDVARRHFPETPMCVNLGWPLEKIVLGQDLTGLVKMLASKGITVRTPTGPMVTHLYTLAGGDGCAVLPHPEAVDGARRHGRRLARKSCGSLVQGPDDRHHSGTSIILDNMDRGAGICSSTRGRCRVSDYFPYRRRRRSSPRPHTGWKTWEWHEGFRGGYPRGRWPRGWRVCGAISLTTSRRGRASDR